jgi:hypothetical protein
VTNSHSDIFFEKRRPAVCSGTAGQLLKERREVEKGVEGRLPVTAFHVVRIILKYVLRIKEV